MEKRDLREIIKDIQLGLAHASVGDLSKQEASKLFDETKLLIERIDMCMLMAAAVGDVALPTNLKITEWEAQYDYPMDGEVIDTEMVYWDVENDAETIINELD